MQNRDLNQENMTYPVEMRHLKRLNVHVKSSLLEALEYDPESHQLNVEYKRKGLFGSRKDQKL